MTEALTVSLGPKGKGGTAREVVMEVSSSWTVTGSVTLECWRVSWRTPRRSNE